MSQSRFANWHRDLQDLSLAAPPIGIAFMSHVPADIGRIERALPPATPDGRAGTFAASCVFWIEARTGRSRRKPRTMAIVASAASRTAPGDE